MVASFGAKCSEASCISCIHSLFVSCDKSLGPSSESWISNIELIPVILTLILVVLFAEWTKWVFEACEDQATDPEISCAELWTAQELTLGSIWLDELEEGIQLVIVLWSMFRNSRCVEASTESAISSLIDFILEGINDHVALLGLHWVIWVVTVGQRQVSHGCAGGTTLEMTVLHLEKW